MIERMEDSLSEHGSDREKTGNQVKQSLPKNGSRM